MAIKYTLKLSADAAPHIYIHQLKEMMKNENNNKIFYRNYYNYTRIYNKYNEERAMSQKERCVMELKSWAGWLVNIILGFGWTVCAILLLRHPTMYYLGFFSMFPALLHWVAVGMYIGLIALEAK
jgi:hypothetical protein